jgi:hypothetical protein
LDELQQDIGDQPQLPIVEAPEPSLADNLVVQIWTTSATVEANFLISSHFFLSFCASSAGF